MNVGFWSLNFGLNARRFAQSAIAYNDRSSRDSFGTFQISRRCLSNANYFN
jgi:hypothetical protein